MEGDPNIDALSALQERAPEITEQSHEGEGLIQTHEQLDTQAESAVESIDKALDDAVAGEMLLPDSVLESLGFDAAQIAELRATEGVDEKLAEVDTLITDAAEQARLDIVAALKEDERPAWELASHRSEILAEVVRSTEGKDYLQEIRDLGELLEKGKEVQGIFSEQMGQLASELGAELMVGPLKKRDRAQVKVNEYIEEFGDEGVHHLVDVVRGTLVFETVDEVYDALPKIQERVEIVRIKPRMEKAIKNGGYGDMLLNLRINGMVVELQLNVRDVLEKKSVGHKLFEQQRILGPLAEKYKKQGETMVPKAEIRTALFGNDESAYGESRVWLDSLEGESVSVEDIMAQHQALDDMQRDLYTAAWAKATQQGN